MLSTNNLKKYLQKNYRNYCKNVKQNKYKNTVILPKTNFPQRLVGKKLSEQNKNVYENTSFKDLYSWQRSTNTNNEFVLHDGPPYANGKLHMGHMINKILKDIINRHQIINGRKVHYVPGWDCHGLPIELKVLQKNKGKSNPLDIRNAARKLASETIEQQKKTFQSWGIIGDWNKSYYTYSVPYIQNEMKQFYKLYEKKLVYRDYKPVYWSPSSRTALAEAELQYNDNHESTSIILKLELSQRPQLLKAYDFDINALIWTTTPWTLPSNQAICFNPNLSYSLIKSPDRTEGYIVASDLINEISETLQIKFDVLLSFTGEMLQYAKYYHPFSKKELPFLSGSHATATKGTGLVHTAPAHGPEDFLLALDNKIPVKCMVDEDGKYTNEAGLFSGLEVLSEGNSKVLEILKDDILSINKYIHSYPYDWRTKKPVILRASQQWFIDTNALKEKALMSLKDVKIVPERNNEIYKQNLITQVQKRPYWCISRQKVWGVPIPVFYHGNQTLITKDSIDHICKLINDHGPDFWWNLPVSNLLSPDLKKDIDVDSIEKGCDIFDIWFDSGISWSYTLENDKIADMYLEGIDQFNGWFQSSLITSVALRDKAPYKMIFVHGFAVDENGLKMSKSLGNVINPEELIEGSKKQQALGIDTLRWWVACHSVVGSTAYVSQNVLQTSQDEVQKIRNTLRFAIASLDGYTQNEEDYKSLKVIDKYLLHLIYKFNQETKKFYNDYQFNKLCIYVINFLTNPVSALYYSIVKDRLYCNSVNDPDRRAVQFVLSHLLENVCSVIAPIVPHLVEEIYMYRTDKKVDSFFKSKRDDVDDDWYQPKIEESVELALNIRKNISKQNSNTLELNTEICAATDVCQKLNMFNELNQLVDLLQVAEYVVKEDKKLENGLFNVNLKKTSNVLCDRCRKYNSKTIDTLCVRCMNVVSNI